ncbi:hypothetical protein THAOC_15125 [Thalassiosira oceanica]|uniref:DUF6743 domain-containing protein n=1 Tax=Thalassiosira oceanica TaxID=159749 RepID=K0ST60_THAOC|nr:hypothetical protein THAOC_15125 [Thalassiosira oceanica]|eukprot:EJK64166.1 hypothetical protein THAOC_15125 [Thalassiosira oceanica]
MRTSKEWMREDTWHFEVEVLRIYGRQELWSHGFGARPVSDGPYQPVDAADVRRRVAFGARQDNEFAVRHCCVHRSRWFDEARVPRGTSKPLVTTSSASEREEAVRPQIEFSAVDLSPEKDLQHRLEVLALATDEEESCPMEGPLSWKWISFQLTCFTLLVTGRNPFGGTLGDDGDPAGPAQGRAVLACPFAFASSHKNGDNDALTPAKTNICSSSKGGSQCDRNWRSATVLTAGQLSFIYTEILNERLGFFIGLEVTTDQPVFLHRGPLALVVIHVKLQCREAVIHLQTPVLRCILLEVLFACTCLAHQVAASAWGADDFALYPPSSDDMSFAITTWPLLFKLHCTHPAFHPGKLSSHAWVSSIRAPYPRQSVQMKEMPTWALHWIGPLG